MFKQNSAKYKSAEKCKAIFGPRIKCWSNAASTPQTFCHDQTKIRKLTYGAIKLKLKKAIVLWYEMIQNSGCRIS